MSSYTADGRFGPDPSMQQPTDTPNPDHVGRPEPVAKTISGANLSMAHSPALAIVALVAIAMVLLSLVNR